MIIRRVSLPLLVALALAGCANSGDSVGAPAPAPSASPSAPAAAPSSAPAPVESGVKTVTGSVTAGVEPDCLLLEDYLLIISDPKQKSAAKPGATVTVTGEVQPGMMTTCQQGTPLVVTTLRAN